MRFARHLGLGLLAAVNLAVIACTGGPGSADEGGDTGDQYSGVTGENGRTVSSDEQPIPSATITTTSPTATTPPAQPPKDLAATDYDQSCSQDTDCVGIYQGAVCGVCTCNNAAINSKDNGKFISDKGTRQIQCALAGQSTSGVNCAPCQSLTAHCDANGCAFR